MQYHHPVRAALLLTTCVLAGCTRAELHPDAATIATEYGLTGVVSDTIVTSAGPLEGTLVPVTLADGRAAHLFVPTYQSRDVEAVYLRDGDSLVPLRISGPTGRPPLFRASAGDAGGLVHDLIMRRHD
jgi:hypothetical protein